MIQSVRFLVPWWGLLWSPAPQLTGSSWHPDVLPADWCSSRCIVAVNMGNWRTLGDVWDIWKMWKLLFPCTIPASMVQYIWQWEGFPCTHYQHKTFSGPCNACHIKSTSLPIEITDLSVENRITSWFDLTSTLLATADLNCTHLEAYYGLR